MPYSALKQPAFISPAVVRDVRWEGMAVTFVFSTIYRNTPQKVSRDCPAFKWDI
jgi:hypothetical protein